LRPTIGERAIDETRRDHPGRSFRADAP
jgi:hypothetical protein